MRLKKSLKEQQNLKGQQSLNWQMEPKRTAEPFKGQ
jgi:hypothetical protein